LNGLGTEPATIYRNAEIKKDWMGCGSNPSRKIVHIQSEREIFTKRRTIMICSSLESESQRLSNIINQKFGVPEKWWVTLYWFSPNDVREKLLAQKIKAQKK
jgi:hypothetical protein